MNTVLHYNRIVRGFENRNKNFAPNARIAIDDEGLVYQDGVDENGIPILYLSYNDDKRKINEIREKINDKLLNRSRRNSGFFLQKRHFP